jgi:hypothetical protein
MLTKLSYRLNPMIKKFAQSLKVIDARSKKAKIMVIKMGGGG